MKDGTPGTKYNVGKYVCQNCRNFECQNCVDLLRSRAGLEGKICKCPKHRTPAAQA